jgi:phage FluMu gp28-like protein
MPQTFTDWCEAYARVEDKRSHRAIPFRLYECQKRVAWQLEAKHWLWILKARRLGLTWLLAAYAVYLMTEKENQTIVVLNQTREYAQDFLERMRLILDHLPDDKRPERKVDNKAQLTFKNGGSVRSVACTRRAIRSLSADLVIFDEAAYMDLLKDARKAAQPAVELGDGQVVAI